MFTVIDIDHLVLHCRDPYASKDFYCKVLGLKLERKITAPLLLQLRAGSALIDLVDNVFTAASHAQDPRLQDSLPPIETKPNMAHFCLNIAETDEQAVLAHLDKHQVKRDEFSEKYGARGYSRSLYLYDPDNNLVELKLLALP